MNDEQLDTAMTSDPDLVPSSGFVQSVMAAVTAEAAAPPPIPFPWTRLWPVAVAGGVAIATFLLGVCGVLPQPTASEVSPTRDLGGLVELAVRQDVQWVALALALTLLAVEVPRRLLSRIRPSSRLFLK